MKNILIVVLLFVGIGCTAKLTPQQETFIFDLMLIGIDYAVAMEAARDKVEQEELKEEIESEVPPEPPQGMEKRQVMCIRHAKNGGADRDGGVAVGEPRNNKPRQFASCSLNGKNINYHGSDHGAHTFWNIGAPAESGDVRCLDYQGYYHTYKMVANKSIRNQCN
ncbi:MAG: hypothetical protein GY820_39270 [Gammaproteobacteria bacterium]|nr:hypothetical protein [Gammaproteobacteria bacterium]